MVIFSFLIWFCSAYPSVMGAISCSISESESVLQRSETEKDAFLHPVFISYKFDEVVPLPCMRSCLRILSYAGAVICFPASSHTALIFHQRLLPLYKQSLLTYTAIRIARTWQIDAG